MCLVERRYGVIARDLRDLTEAEVRLWGQPSALTLFFFDYSGLELSLMFATDSLGRVDAERGAASREFPAVTAAKARSDRPAWAAAIAGVTIGLGAQMYGLLAGESTLDLVSSRIGDGTAGLLEIPHADPVVFLLAAGLLLYLTGLFAPLRGTVAPGAQREASL